MVSPETKVIDVKSKKYRYSTMCTYHFRFDMRAGHNDVIEVVFDLAEETGVGYAVGTSYSNAQGAKLDFP